ncbi:MAG: hypothetical protein ACXWZF_09540 [Actinomycetota bacterium]
MIGRVVVWVAVVLLALGAIGCTEEQRGDLVDQGTEAVVRNLAATAGAGVFEREGFEVDGTLDCEASSSGGAERIEVRCTGVTHDGEELVLEGDATTGSADIGDAVRGSFVGTADGEEVFQEQCLGDGC